MIDSDLRALKNRAGDAVEKRGPELHAIAVDLHDRPEVGWTETESSARLTAYLQQAGFAVERGLSDMPTAFRATLDSGRPGPTVALVAEFDALPGVGHGCGHNLIAAGAVGAAIGAQAALSELSGRIVVIGTPAEEFTGELQGKIQLLRAGQFAGADTCLMFHPWTTTAPINSSLAFVAFNLEFHGHTAHAAADPWNGRNALDAVILTFNHISALRQHIPPDVRIHGIITDGGVVPNIIPERAAAQFMARARRHGRVREILERLRGCAEGAALATGTTMDFRVVTEAADTVAYPTLQAVTRANFELLGVPFGEPIDWTASTDFGDVTYEIPSDSFFIGVGLTDVPWHSAEVAAASIEPPAQQSMLNGAKVLAMNAIDLLADPSIIARARAEKPAAPGQ